MLHPAFDLALELLQSPATSIDALYENWWSGAGTEKFRAMRDSALHRGVMAKYLFQRGETHVVSTAESVFALKAGDFAWRSDKTVEITRWSQWANDNWIWLQGETPSRYPGNDNEFRVYLPTKSLDSESIAADVSQILNDAQVPFQLKYRREIGSFSDSIVIWIRAELVSNFIDLTSTYLSGLEGAVKPPPLAYQLEGFGVCVSPKSGESFGWRMCEELWSARRDASHSEVPNAVKNHLSVLGLDVYKPWNYWAQGFSVEDYLK